MPAENSRPYNAPVFTLEATAFNADQINAHLGELAIRGEAQVALAGRSNVGKSSLVNALANRKNLAKTSATPGKTRSINFYHAEQGKSVFSVVDLPGYGYAQCSQAERNAWAKLIDYYLTTASDLRAVVLLIDCRLEPQRLDRELAEFAMSRGLRIVPVLTKADKCTQNEQAARCKTWSVILNGAVPIAVSSLKGRGIEKLWNAMADVCTDLPETIPETLFGQKSTSE